jgi:hypothetical protein
MWQEHDNLYPAKVISINFPKRFIKANVKLVLNWWLESASFCTQYIEIDYFGVFELLK